MRIPNKLTANNPHAVAINQLIDCIRALSPKSSDTIRAKHSPDGFVLEIIARPSNGTGTNSAWRGEWTPDASYNVGDLVVISTGSNRGAFAANLPNTNQPPWVGGVFWTQFPFGTPNEWLMV